MRTGMLKEVGQVHLIFFVRVLLKADGDHQPLVLFRVDIATEKGIVNTAKVDKIERRTSHNEKGLEIIFSFDTADIAEDTAALGHFELASADKFIVDVRAVCKTIGVIYYRAELAIFFLLVF